MVARIAAKLIIVALLVATVNCSSGFASFSYGVSDPNTGDVKDQHEKREGGNVVGKYSLLESDGTKRVVEYSASDATGFNAVVHKEPAGIAGAVNALGHAGLAAGGHGGLGVATPAIHSAPFTHRAPHSGIPLGHGAQNALSYANSNIVNPALAHGSLGHGSALNGLAGNLAGGYAGHAAPAVSHYANSIVHDVRPYSGQYAGAYGGYGAQAGLSHGAALGQGGLGASFAHGSLNYGHRSSLAGGLAGNQINGIGGNLAGGYAGHGASTVSHYAKSVVHDVRPYAGQYAGAFGAHGAQAPWSNSGLASPVAHGGWSSPLASGALSHGGVSSFAHGSFGAANGLAYGARGANAGWSW